MANQRVYVSPSYSDFLHDKLFDLDDKVLNIDDGLLPGVRLRDHLLARGKTLQTADYLLVEGEPYPACDYVAFGTCLPLELLQSAPQVRPRAFVIFEPPVVAPHLYHSLPVLTQYFERVYLHNTEGDGYSLEGVDRSRLHRFHWPQTYGDVQEPYWSNRDRMRRYVMINGCKAPTTYDNELYSLRVRAVAAMHDYAAVDLYGMGWERLNGGYVLWWPYWRFRHTLQSVFRGVADHKLATLSQYDFALCFENMAMRGYVTEKIFGCLYAGTIPIYMGAPDIAELIPPETFIDLRHYGTWADLHEAVMQLSDSRIQEMREAGRDFLRSDKGQAYFNGMLEIFESSSG